MRATQRIALLIVALTIACAPTLSVAPAHGSGPSKEWTRSTPGKRPWTRDIAIDTQRHDLYLAHHPDHVYESEAGQLLSLDGRTGDTRWAFPTHMNTRQVAVDGTRGIVYVLGQPEQDPRTSLIALDRAGTELWRVTGPQASRLLGVRSLVVEPTAGLVCALLGQDREPKGQRWITSCWSHDGAEVFTAVNDPAEHTRGPGTIRIDGDTGHVYVTGVQRQGEHGGITTIAYSTSGTTLWERTAVFSGAPEVVDLVINPHDHQVTVMLTSGYHRLVSLVGYDAEGRRTLRRTFAGSPPYSSAALALAPVPGSSRSVSVISTGPELQVHQLDGSGRTRRLAPIRLDRNLDDWPLVTLDPRRRLLHVVEDLNVGDTFTSAFSYSGRRLWGSRLADDEPIVTALDPRAGRFVVVAQDRITAVGG